MGRKRLIIPEFLGLEKNGKGPGAPNPGGNSRGPILGREKGLYKFWGNLLTGPRPPKNKPIPRKGHFGPKGGPQEGFGAKNKTTAPKATPGKRGGDRECVKKRV